jgi:hypothetical protein
MARSAMNHGPVALFGRRRVTKGHPAATQCCKYIQDKTLSIIIIVVVEQPVLVKISAMSKRKANALPAPTAKKPRPSAADLMSDDGDDGSDLLRRAMEMQNDFEQDSDASEPSEDDPDGFEDLEDDVPQVAAPVVALEEPAAKLPLALIVSLVHPSILHR